MRTITIIFTLTKQLPLWILLALLIPQLGLADVRLPRLLSDGAILQRDRPITLWGWADEGEKVTVNFGKHKRTTATTAGRWSVTFPAMKAGGPYDIRIQANNQLHLKDIWLGDLWITAGQSNMELPLRRVHYRYPSVIAHTNLPQVREFSVPVTYAFDGPKDDFVQGEWKAATPEHLPGFSAVGFFFAQQLHQAYNVPIGLVSISVGGSPAEAWMSESALKKYPHHLEAATKFKDEKTLQDTIASDKARSDAWYNKANADDMGLEDEKKSWFSEQLNTDDWKPFQVPGFVRAQHIDFNNGVIWFRKTIHLTAEQAQQDAQLWLGAIVDGDQVYINGTLVGQTGYQYPPRIYSVPANTLKAGKNEISVRVTSYSSNPGFVKDKTYALKLGNEEINLQGDWVYKVGMRAEPMPASTTIHYQPTSLFNAKLAPVLPFNIKGVIWYQGESNVARAQEYAQLFPDLIIDWRTQFKQGDFPFIFAQLANFLAPSTTPTESDWAQLREAQRNTLRLPKTAMAVAIDLGEWNDIHPLNKQDVGQRLALAAQKLAYGEKSLVASGPLVDSVKRKGNTLVVRFDHVAKGLEVRGDAVQEIAIAGADKKFVWAKTKVQSKQLVVWSDAVKEPVWVRYAWADNPAGANLYNSAGLPASPFQASINDD